MRAVPPPPERRMRPGDEGFENGWFGKSTDAPGSTPTRGANGRRPGSVNGQPGGQSNGQVNGRANGSINDRLGGSRNGQPPIPPSRNGVPPAARNGTPPDRPDLPTRNGVPPAARNGMPPAGPDNRNTVPPIGPNSRDNMPPVTRNGMPPAGPTNRNSMPPANRNGAPPTRNTRPPAGPDWPSGPVTRTNLPPTGGSPPTARIPKPNEPPTMAIPVSRLDPPTMAHRLTPPEPAGDDTPTDPGPFGRVAFETHPPVPPAARRRHSVDGPIEGDPRDVPEPETAEAGTPKKKTKRKLPFWIELPVLVVVALLLTFTIQTFVARVYVIPSGSMELTLHGNNGTGDRILVDKVVYDFHPPRPGDVVVFKGPPGWDQTEFFVNNETNPVLRWLHDLASSIGVAKPDEYDLVKRVIAVGGETIMCCDAQHRIVVNGKSLNEPYVYWQPDRGGPAQQQPFGPITVPQGYLWVMGDNRNNSDDSRFQNGGGIHGVVPVGNVIGKARTIIWPPSRWRGIGDYDAQTAAGIADGAPNWIGVPATGVGVLACLPTLWFGRRFGKRLRLAAGIHKPR